MRFGRESEEEATSDAAEANGLGLETVHPVAWETPDGQLRSGKRHLYVYTKVE